MTNHYIIKLHSTTAIFNYNYTYKKIVMNKTILLVLILLFVGAQSSNAQQDPMFTKYMFNSLMFNPAYAGSKDHMSITLLHRDQWWGIEGAPKTQSFTIHTPLKRNRVGIGLSVYNDKIGPSNQLNISGSYAYRIPFGDNGDKGKLAIGLQAGILNWRADLDGLNLENEIDEAFDEGRVNYWLPNFGVGLHYYSKYFYVGLGVPHLIDHDLRKDFTDQIDPNNPQNYAKQYRHYFLTGGVAIPVSKSIVFKPSFLIKNIGLFGEFTKDELRDVASPNEIDLDVSFLFYEALWIGASFRTSFEAFGKGKTSSMDSADLWAAYYLRNGFRIGVAYDYTLTDLQSYAQGSFEVMLGYELNFKESKIVTPRYF